MDIPLSFLTNLGQQAANCYDDDGHDHESPKLILSGILCKRVRVCHVVAIIVMVAQCNMHYSTTNS